jgi:malonyl-CoA O-methyltransferase
MTQLDTLMREGCAHYVGGRPEEAERCFRSILETDAGHKESCNNLGVIAYERGDHQDALAKFTRALETDPYYRDAVVNVCDLLREMGVMAEAVPLLEEQVKAQPGDEEMSALLAEAKTHLVDPAEPEAMSFRIRPEEVIRESAAAVRSSVSAPATDRKPAFAARPPAPVTPIARAGRPRERAAAPVDRRAPASRRPREVVAPPTAETVGSLERAIHWLRSNMVPEQGIVVSSRNRSCYPEVTGYCIPTLFKVGEHELARDAARWLATIQRPDGSVRGPNDTVSYAFDTGMVVRGWVAALQDMPELEGPIRRACDWLLQSADADGRLPAPATEAWSLGERGTVPEAIHLYVLPAVEQAGELLDEPRYLGFARKSLAWYKANCDLTDFTQRNALTHFHGYVVEALCDLGEVDLAKQAIAELSPYQQENGAIPAYSDVKWVCTPGLAQLALCCYRLGYPRKADRAMHFLEMLQNPEGGFFGSYGIGADYFPDAEISWAVKYFVDAYLEKIAGHFDVTAPDFEDQVSPSDGRLKELLRIGGDLGRKRVLDAGCGKGRYAKRIREAFPGAQVTGLDLSPVLLSHVPSEIRAVHASLLDMPFEDGAFDFVYCVEALEHAVQIEQAVAELARVTAPGGKLVIIDKNREHLGSRSMPNWEKWFERGEIMDLMRRNGLEPSADFVGYNRVVEPDGLFVCWTGVKEPAAVRAAA